LITFFKRVLLNLARMPEKLVNEFRKKISLKEFEVTNTSSSGGSYSKGFQIKEAEKNLQVKIITRDERDIEFDMIGYDPSIVNALRRLLISDVPSMAIEKVHMYQNTSIMQDEVLAHRMGLIPLKADPRLFAWKPEKQEGQAAKVEGGDDAGTEADTLEYRLQVRCKTGGGPGGANTDEKVLASQIQWLPRGSQSSWAGDCGPTEGDILVNKLRPGHEMEMILYAVKGVGRDHAKFSPVSTAFYRLLPSISLLRPVRGEAAVRMQKCFSPGVIGIRQEEGQQVAVVEEARLDSCSRNIYRYEDLKEAVSLDKVQHSEYRVQPSRYLISLSALDLAELR